MYFSTPILGSILPMFSSTVSSISDFTLRSLFNWELNFKSFYSSVCGNLIFPTVYVKGIYCFLLWVLTYCLLLNGWSYVSSWLYSQFCSIRQYVNFYANTILFLLFLQYFLRSKMVNSPSSTFLSAQNYILSSGVFAPHKFYFVFFYFQKKKMGEFSLELLNLKKLLL